MHSIFFIGLAHLGIAIFYSSLQKHSNSLRLADISGSQPSSSDPTDVRWGLDVHSLAWSFHNLDVLVKPFLCGFGGLLGVTDMLKGEISLHHNFLNLFIFSKNLKFCMSKLTGIWSYSLFPLYPLWLKPQSQLKKRAWCCHLTCKEESVILQISLQSF